MAGFRKISIREWARKWVHFIFGTIIIIVGLSVRKKFEVQLILLALFILLVIFIIFDYLRAEFRINVPGYSFFLRSKETERFSSAVFILIAAIVSMSFYNYYIALAAITMHLFGDGAAALIGKRFGKIKIFKKKTFIGSLSAFIVNIIVGLIILNNIIIIGVMALASTLLELYIEKLDDNLIVPLFAGLVGHILLFFIG